MRLLEWLEHPAHAEVGRPGALGAELPSAALQPVRRILRPQRDHVLHRLDEDRVAVLVHGLHHLGIRGKTAGADAEDEASFEQRVHHRDLRGGRCGMPIGEIHRATAEPDALRVARERGNEDQAGSDGLGEVGEVLADERFLETKLLGEEHRLPILGERLAPVAPHGMQRHGEVAKLHRALLARIRQAAVLICAFLSFDKGMGQRSAASRDG